MEPAPIPFTVAILAGGKSSRMGTDKAFVSLRGRPLIAHILARCAALGQAETLIVSNNPAAYERFGLRLVGDLHRGKGALGGIQSVLVHARTPYALVIGCDMPLIQPALLRHLIACAAEVDSPYDAVVPRVDGYPQGLLSLYRKTALPEVERLIAVNMLKVKRLFERLAVRYVDEPEYAPFDPAGLSFRNANTPADLAAIEQSLANDASDPPPERLG